MPTPGLAPNVPEDLREIVERLNNYGYRLTRDGNAWRLQFPPGHPARITQVGFFDSDLATGLMRILHEEEQRSGVLYNFKQYDNRWGNLIYGNGPGFSTIHKGGCGPTSLAIILHHLMNNGSRPRNACVGISPIDTARYAATHGRVASGTVGDDMVRGIAAQWPGFGGSKVSLAQVSGLLREGKLILFSSHGSHGYSESKFLQGAPDIDYAHHFMVLAGIEERSAPQDVLYYVADPARKANGKSMKFIKRSGFSAGAKFWWVYQTSELSNRVCR